MFRFTKPHIMCYLLTEVHLISFFIFHISINRLGTLVAQWLRFCATNWKVAGSIPDGVIGIFH